MKTPFRIRHLAAIIILLSGLTGSAQKGSTITPSYVSVNFSDEVYSLVQPNSTFDFVLGGLEENPEGLKNTNPAKYLYIKGKSQMTELMMSTLKEKLDLELKPLGELMGKIDYLGSYPSEPKFKKVLKKAPGELYYLYFSTSIYKGGVGIASDISIGGNLKPTTAITLIIANKKGKVIQEFEIKEKADQAIGKTKTSFGDIELGEGMNPDEVLANLMTIYEKALNSLIEEYQKKNKKDYKS